MSDQASPVRVLACSYAAATGALLINFPLDTIKTRIQASPEDGFGSSIRSLWREDGVRGFYRGVSASSISSSAARAMSMGLYTSFVPKFAQSFRVPMQTPNDRPSVPVFFAGLSAGAFSCILTGPFEFTKTASQVESLIVKQRNYRNRSIAAPLSSVPMSAKAPASSHHDSMAVTRSPTSTNTNSIGPTSSTRSSSTVSSSAVASSATGTASVSTSATAGNSSSSGHSGPRKTGALRTVHNLMRRGGFAQSYGGVEYHCLRDSVGSAIYFTVYEATKKMLSRQRPGDPPSPAAVAVAGGLCGAASWLAVYPIDTMKSEYQRDLYSRTLVPTSLEYNDTVVRRPKFRFSLKMYRGSGFSLMRTSLNGVCSFSFFEYFMWITS